MKRKLSLALDWFLVVFFGVPTVWIVWDAGYGLIGLVALSCVALLTAELASR